MKKLNLSLLALAGVLALSACKKEKENKTTDTGTTPVTTNTGTTPSTNTGIIPTTTEEGVDFSIKYTNYLGETTEEKFNTKDYDNVLNALKSKFDVVESNGYISKINDSFKDPNWAIMIYENGETATVGVDGLVIDENDEFEFKFECWNTIASGWGTFDEYEILVDKAIYNYAINKLPNILSPLFTFSGNNYWESMSLYKMINAKNEYGNLYDTNIFNANIYTENYVNAIKAYDVTKLSGNDYFKYYYSARLFDNINLDTFKEKYTDYLKTLTEFESFGEYKYPFIISTAKTLGLESNISSAITNPEYRPDSSQFGPDGLSWLLTGMSSANTITDDDINLLKYDLLENSYSKDTSLTSMIIPLVSRSLDPRGYIKDSNERDILKILFDDYFDLETFKFTTEASDSDYSSNQIYAALIAYKVFRDTHSATNLFE